jgi:hypothetical protein
MNWLEGILAWFGLEQFANRFEQIDGGDGRLELLLILLAATAAGAGIVALNARARAFLLRLAADLSGMRRTPR